MLSASDLVSFEHRVAGLFAEGLIRGPVHLSGGNEKQLIEIFSHFVGPTHWVFSSWRWHYHALLHGVRPDEILHHLKTRDTMNACFPERRFYTSAIAGGILPIACGVAAGVKASIVHCFVGDMTAEMGIYHEVSNYAAAHHLPLRIYIEDNGFATDTPTTAVWPHHSSPPPARYTYTRTWPHMQKSPFQGPKL